MQVIYEKRGRVRVIQWMNWNYLSLGGKVRHTQNPKTIRFPIDTLLL